MFLTIAAIGNADQTDEIYALIEQDKLSDAMQQTKSMLAESPGDPSLLFAQAIIAEKNGSPKDAIRIYQGLTLSHPELLEPFNNLAIHYARAGDYKAAISTLELAMQVHPSVATAYRNLTAIYEQLASAAYRKALNSDAPLVPLELASLEKIDTSTPGDTKEQPRLVASVESYLNESLGSEQSAADEGTSKVSIEIDPATAVEESAQLSTDSSPPNEPEQDRDVKAAPAEPAVTVETESVIEPSEPEPEPEPEPIIVAAVTPTAEARQAAEDNATQKQALIDRVKSWASAWSDRDVDRYLSHYSESFKPRDNMTLEEWKKQRYGRLRWREFIIVKPSEYSISVEGDSAAVNFSQYYKSERFEDTIRKTLEFKKEKGRWLITRELI
ncbi:MAG: hypothetical protein P8Y12_06015 [Gammaproteobacteria bacterium]